jgi:anti-sigma factor RsiW
MYQNGAGQRITLYVGALAADAARPSGPGAAPTVPPSPAAAFQFAHDGPVPAFYWVDDGFGYALSGQLSRPELLALATSVYQQLPQSQ